MASAQTGNRYITLELIGVERSATQSSSLTFRRFAGLRRGQSSREPCLAARTRHASMPAKRSCLEAAIPERSWAPTNSPTPKFFRSTFPARKTPLGLAEMHPAGRAGLSGSSNGIWTGWSAGSRRNHGNHCVRRGHPPFFQRQRGLSSLLTKTNVIRIVRIHMGL